MWNTQGRLTNPATGAVLADTGPLPEHIQNLPQIFVSSSVACAVLFEVRDAANANTVQSMLFPLQANQNFEITPTGYYPPPLGGRYRLAMNAGVTGVVQGSLFY